MFKLLCNLQPPFVMDKWVIGLSNNQTVDCTVNYEVSWLNVRLRLPIAHTKYFLGSVIFP